MVLAAVMAVALGASWAVAVAERFAVAPKGPRQVLRVLARA